jgi:hypothetical protein
MTRKERKELLKLLQEHVSNISNLQFGNYVLAEALTQKTKVYCSLYFPDRSYYFYDIINSNFRASTNDANASRLAWDQAQGRLLAISHLMLEELKITNVGTGISFLRIIISISFLLASYILWTFNSRVKWQWLADHPKRIPLYLSVQSVIILISALILTNNKQGKFIEWVGIIISLLSLIISTLV